MRSSSLLNFGYQRWIGVHTYYFPAIDLPDTPRILAPGSTGKGTQDDEDELIEDNDNKYVLWGLTLSLVSELVQRMGYGSIDWPPFVTNSIPANAAIRLHYLPLLFGFKPVPAWAWFALFGAGFHVARKAML